MSGLRTIALMEAERLALVEALNAMTQLADVRERMYSEERDESKDLLIQVLQAEKLGEERAEKLELETASLLEERAGLKEQLAEEKREFGAELANRSKFVEQQDNRERRILAAFETVIAGMHPDHIRHARGLMNAALAEEIQF